MSKLIYISGILIESAADETGINRFNCCVQGGNHDGHTVSIWLFTGRPGILCQVRRCQECGTVWSNTPMPDIAGVFDEGLGAIELPEAK